jgi:hypothetical protein
MEPRSCFEWLSQGKKKVLPPPTICSLSVQKDGTDTLFLFASRSLFVGLLNYLLLQDSLTCYAVEVVFTVISGQWVMPGRADTSPLRIKPSEPAPNTA